MPYKTLNLGIILLPSLRSLAYLHAMAGQGVAPKEIILMQGAIPKLKEVQEENRRYGYHRLFFDVGFSTDHYLHACGAKVLPVETADINSPLIQNLVQKSATPIYLFTGGGIVKRPLFETGKKFLHVHPGKVPSFRGSTCFYYSLLQELSLGSTAFFMEETIDTGLVIAESHFDINYSIKPDQPLFVDQILDPYIRAHTLKKVLVALKANQPIIPKPQFAEGPPAYYVMHPFLRHIAIQKVNQSYDPHKKIGIVETRQK